MRVILSEEEKSNLSFVDIGSRELSEMYLVDRDTYWEKAVEEGERKGKSFWNGTLYSFEGIEQTGMNDPVVKLGEMTYSDRLFKRSISPIELDKKYGVGHRLSHCGVGIHVLTSDNCFIVGVKKMTEYLKGNRLAHISGNLNKDELTVSNTYDLFKYAELELGEESSIDVDSERLRFVSINIFRSYCNFEFLYLGDFKSDEVNELFNDTEFKSFEALSLEEILNDKRECISDLEYLKPYLGELLQIR